MKSTKRLQVYDRGFCGWKSNRMTTHYRFLSRNRVNDVVSFQELTTSDKEVGKVKFGVVDFMFIPHLLSNFLLIKRIDNGRVDWIRGIKIEQLIREFVTSLIGSCIMKLLLHATDVVFKLLIIAGGTWLSHGRDRQEWVFGSVPSSVKTYITWYRCLRLFSFVSLSFGI